MRHIILFLLLPSFGGVMAADKPAFDPSSPDVWREKPTPSSPPDDIRKTCQYISTPQCNAVSDPNNPGDIDKERQRREEKRKYKDIENGEYRKKTDKWMDR